MLLKFFMAPLFIFAWSCTPNLREKDIDLKDPVNESDLNFKKVSLKSNQQVFKTSVDKVKVTLEYFECAGGSGHRAVVALNPDDQGFSANVCASPEVQSLAARGYDILAVNRPGYGGSKPEKDFGGKVTQQSLRNFIDAQKRPVEGIWGTGSGSIPAAFCSKNSKSVQWVMIGNGIFDLEVYQKTASANYKTMIDQSRGQEDENAYLEVRSVAWDLSGLPPMILLYHAKSNTEIPIAQSQMMRDGLAASEHKVFLEEVDGVGNQIEGLKQRVIMERLLDKGFPKAP